MDNSVVTALILAGFTLIIVKIVSQLKTIELFHHLSKGLLYTQPLIILVFSIMAVKLAETLLDYSVFISAAVALILSIYNNGFTKNGILPNIEGGALRNMIGQEFQYSETRDWIILEQKKRLKVRFTVDHTPTHSNVYYIYFDKKNKETIQSLLHSNNLSVSVERDR